MNEFIEIGLRKPNDQRVRIMRQTPGGIELEETDPLERTVGVSIAGRGDATKHRMQRIGQVKGWHPGEFKLKMAVERGNLVLRGVDADALPLGFYWIGLEIEEARVQPRRLSVEVTQDGNALVDFKLEQDEREVETDLLNCSAAVDRVLSDSTVDGRGCRDWVLSTQPRATKRACLLNLLSVLSVTPTKSAPLIDDVHEVFRVFNDRAFFKVSRLLLTRLQELALDPARPVYAEGTPTAPIHARLLRDIPEPIETIEKFQGLSSFRAEGKPSLQSVVAIPPTDLPYTFAEFDLDLGNPLQDVVGFITHMGELFSGKPTNHLDMRRNLASTKAAEFLYYKVV
jgi:hypothetical protein